MISLNWVKDYIDLEGEDLKELAVKITKAGVNVENVVTNHIDNLVIGEVIDCKEHPDSDHMHVCMVNDGTTIRQIVCGAANVKAGIKVIVALPGCHLPNGVDIKRSVIRGQESNGMICALFEIGVEEKTEETYNKGIYIVDDKAKIGTDAMEYLGLDDTLYELDVHKHRNNDCYYHIGFAYEIAAILNKKVKLPDLKYEVIKDSIFNHYSLKVETPKCPYYSAKMVTDIKIGESPEFIKKRLIAAGMRPINNVVDISNYVMLEFGQPLHFFDKDKLGDKVVVRDAKEGEPIVTLDGKKRILKASDIVITDGEKPVAIAGVMGGENTDVDANTKTIVIESAIFSSTSIRYTASRLNLKSEASIRYGKGLDYEYAAMALDRACYLLAKYADAKILDGIALYDVIDKKDKVAEFTSEELSTVLGINIAPADVEVELNRLDFPYERKDNKFKVTIPKRRLDIDPHVNDIAEEVGRLYGYHNLVSTLPKIPMRRGVYAEDVYYRKLMSKRLRSLGLNESKTYTLVSKEMTEIFNYDESTNIALPNPMSADKSYIRTTLLPSLLGIYDYNKARKVSDIFLYEVSKVYDSLGKEKMKAAILMKGDYLKNEWQGLKVTTDFYVIKGIVENVLDYFGLKNRYTFEKAELAGFHPGISARIILDRKPIGVIGRIHPTLKKDDIYMAEIDVYELIKNIKPIKYKEPLRYPEIRKDVAFVVNSKVSASELKEVIKRSGGRLLKDINVFDLYVGDKIAKDKKSIAYALTFADPTRTLEDKEVTDIFNKIISDVETKFNATIRDK